MMFIADIVIQFEKIVWLWKILLKWIDAPLTQLTPFEKGIFISFWAELNIGGAKMGSVRVSS